ncbi:MAG: thiol:disulfide interchange protein, partial [Bacteroidaceae bacterium]|nr:thiol:disulfide interchange protein [Bacteroidaceae bacterium]
MKRLFTILLALCCLGVAQAQFAKPVKVTTTIKETSATEAVITFVASIQSGWHMYSTQVVEDGPTPTTINVEKITGAELDGPLKTAAAPIKKYEDMFDADVYFFENTATFTQKLKLLGGKYEVEGYLQFGACNDQNCIPPTSEDFSFKGEVAAPKVVDVKKDEQAEQSVPEAAAQEEETPVVEEADSTAEVVDSVSSALGEGDI